MSEIITDKLTGRATANDVTVTVGATATQSLEQGLAKAWISVSGSVAIYGSFNISSATDHGTGDYSFDMNNAFASVNAYCQTATVFTSAQGRTSTRNSGRDAAGTLAAEVSDASGTLTDGSSNQAAHGDLA